MITSVVYYRYISHARTSGRYQRRGHHLTMASCATPSSPSPTFFGMPRLKLHGASHLLLYLPLTKGRPTTGPGPSARPGPHLARTWRPLRPPSS